MIVNESTALSLGGGSAALPALIAHVTYSVQGYASAQSTLLDIDVPLVIGVLGIFALIAVAAFYVILKS